MSKNAFKTLFLCVVIGVVVISIVGYNQFSGWSDVSTEKGGDGVMVSTPEPIVEAAAITDSAPPSEVSAPQAEEDVATQANTPEPDTIPVAQQQPEPETELEASLSVRQTAEISEYAGLGNEQMQLKAFELYTQARELIDTADARLPDSWGNATAEDFKEIDPRDYDKAARLLEKAVLLKPDYAKAYCALGMAYSSLGYIDETVSMYEKALELDADYVEPRFFVAGLYAMQRKPELALAQYEKTVELQPDHGEAYACMASIYEGAGDIEKAVELYEKGAKVAGDSDGGLTCTMSMAGLKGLMGDYDAAIAAYTKVINAKPNFLMAYSNRGLMYLKSAQYEKGIADCDKAIELDPESDVVYYDRARCYYNWGKFDEAMIDIDRALEIQPDAPLYLFCRSRIWFAISELGNAWNDLRAVEKLGHDVPSDYKSLIYDLITR